MTDSTPTTTAVSTYTPAQVAEHRRTWVIDDELLGERGVKTTLTIVGRLWLGLRAVDPLVPYQLPGFAHWSIEALSALNDSTSWTLERIADVVEALPLEWDGTVSWARTYVD